MPLPALVRPPLETTPEKVVVPVLSTVTVRVAAPRPTVPDKVRSLLPPTLKLPPTVRGLAMERAPLPARIVPPLSAMPLLLAALLPNSTVPALMMVPSCVLLAPLRTRVKVPFFVRLSVPALSERLPLRVTVPAPDPAKVRPLVK